MNAEAMRTSVESNNSRSLKKISAMCDMLIEDKRRLGVSEFPFEIPMFLFGHSFYDVLRIREELIQTLRARQLVAEADAARVDVVHIHFFDD